MAVKVTFTFDQATVDALRRTAARQRLPKSAVARAAIREYEQSSARLSPAERERMLAILDEIQARGNERTQAEVDGELAAIRAARRQGGRRHRSI